MKARLQRTLGITARFVDHWNLPFATPEVFSAKRAILEQHCQDVGRDSCEIVCSVQIALPVDQSPQESAAQAAGLGEAGVDLVIFTMRNPYSLAMLDPLSVALESIGGAN